MLVKKAVSAGGRGRSVGRGAVDGVDDEDFDGVLGGDYLDAELLFKRADERGGIGRVGGIGGAQGCPGEVLDVEGASEAGVIDDGAGFNFSGAKGADDAGESLHLDGAPVGHAEAVAIDHGHRRAGRQRDAGADLDRWVAGFGLGRRGDGGDLEAALGGHKLIDGQDAGL